METLVLKSVDIVNNTIQVCWKKQLDDGSVTGIHRGSYSAGQKDQFMIDVANYAEYIDLIDWIVYPEVKTQGQIVAEAIVYFEGITTQFIESKVQAYNIANGLAFANIDAFPKYALNTASQHHTIANQFIVYADNVWKAVRAYQATLTAIPTDVEFQAVLDGVTF